MATLRYEHYIKWLEEELSKARNQRDQILFENERLKGAQSELLESLERCFARNEMHWNNFWKAGTEREQAEAQRDQLLEVLEEITSNYLMLMGIPDNSSVQPTEARKAKEVIAQVKEAQG
jgi:hypothetical protein